MLPAENGDCLWVEYGTTKTSHRILIDCGAVSAATLVRELIRQRADDDKLDFELFVLTHIDADHISGAIPLFEDSSLPARFSDIWFNGWQQLRGFLSVRQGEQFSKILGDPKRGLNWNRAFTTSNAKHASPVVVQSEQMPSITLPSGMKITLLSPTAHELTMLARRWGAALAELKRKGMLSRRAPRPVTNFNRFPLEQLANKQPRKDSSVPNASSIGFLAEYGGRSALFTGDAHANVLAASIKALQKIRGATDQRLKLNALKLSHHGSANALTKGLLDVIDCDTYLIPTDGSRFYHPDREAVSRIVLWGGVKPKLYFNYRSELNELWANEHLQEKYVYSTEYPKPDDTGLRVDI